MMTDPNAASTASPRSPRLNPTALTLADAARLLTQTGETGAPIVTAKMLQEFVDAGAPTNADGTINLSHLTAWLVRETSKRGDQPAQAATE